mgnify:CR=1 FL=1
MSTLLWIAIALQTVMGAFDTIWHHEGIERLAWRPSQAHELRLHGIRNLIYALVFAIGTAGWCWLAHWLVHHRRFRVLLRRYGEWLVPWVLLAIGLHVLWGARGLVGP